MDKEQLSTFISISLGIITPFIATSLIYSFYFNVGDLSMVVLFPLLAVLLAIIAFLTIINLINSWKWAFFGNLLFPVLTAVFSFVCIGNKILKDSPTVMVQAQFDNREGFEIFLREDMTVKVIETTMISSTEKYGRYKLSGDTVFLFGINIEYGFSEVNDTLYFKEDKLVFRLDKEWRSVLESSMYIVEDRLH